MSDQTNNPNERTGASVSRPLLAIAMLVSVCLHAFLLFRLPAAPPAPLSDEIEVAVVDWPPAQSPPDAIPPDAIPDADAAMEPEHVTELERLAVPDLEPEPEPALDAKVVPELEPFDSTPELDVTAEPESAPEADVARAETPEAPSHAVAPEAPPTPGPAPDPERSDQKLDPERMAEPALTPASEAIPEPAAEPTAEIDSTPLDSTPIDSTPIAAEPEPSPALKSTPAPPTAEVAAAEPESDPTARVYISWGGDRAGDGESYARRVIAAGQMKVAIRDGDGRINRELRFAGGRWRVAPADWAFGAEWSSFAWVVRDDPAFAAAVRAASLTRGQTLIICVPRAVNDEVRAKKRLALRRSRLEAEQVARYEGWFDIDKWGVLRFKVEAKPK